jgi:hypothetical protein
MADRNYPPGDFADRTNEVVGPLVLAPEEGGAGYDDVWKVSNCVGCQFSGIEVKAGKQRENAQDLNRYSSANRFTGLVLDAGGQGAILAKGGSSDNTWDDVLIRKAGGNSDVMIGGYSQQSRATSKNNRFNNIRREDGKPVRYAYTFLRAHRPRFTNSKVEFQFWWSLVRTIDQEIKYLFA